MAPARSFFPAQHGKPSTVARSDARESIDSGFGTVADSGKASSSRTPFLLHKTGTRRSARESMLGKPSRIRHSDARENIHGKQSTIANQKLHIVTPMRVCSETINNCTNPLDALRGGTGAFFLSGTIIAHSGPLLAPPSPRPLRDPISKPRTSNT